MKLSELFEDAEASNRERAFQDAWTSARPLLKAKGINPSYYGKVQSRAHELALSYGMDVDDSISTAASEVSAKTGLGSKSADKFKQAAMDKSRSPFSAQKRWANQHGSGGDTKIDQFKRDISDIVKKDPFSGELNTNSKRRKQRTPKFPKKDK